MDNREVHVRSMWKRWSMNAGTKQVDARRNTEGNNDEKGPKPKITPDPRVAFPFDNGTAATLGRTLRFGNRTKLYKYDKLEKSRQQIRLFKFDRFQKNRLTCDIKTFHIDEAPVYQAISYEWGSAVHMHEIRINSKVLKIRDNLFQLLLKLILEEQKQEGKWMWVDQICINQTDVNERNHQVRLMCQIYSSAASVVIWLGDCGLARECKSVQTNRCRAHKTGVCKTLRLDDLLCFSRNSYFSRLWILQELFLAKERRVLISITGIDKGYSIPWRLLECSFAEYEGQFSGDGYSHFKNCMLRLSKIGAEVLPLHTALGGFSANNCQDPRDKVYGLLGIVSPDQHVHIDYHKHTCEVIVDALRVVITEDLDMWRDSDGYYNSYSDGDEANKQVAIDVLRDLFNSLGERMGLSAVQLLRLNEFLDGVLDQLSWTMHSKDERVDVFRLATEAPVMAFDPGVFAKDEGRWLYEVDGVRHVIDCNEALVVRG